MRRLASTLLLLGAITACEQQAPLYGDSAEDLRFVLLWVYFDFDSAKLKPQDFQKIKITAQQLKTVATRRVIIEGFTDRAGSDSYNQRLSLQRANAVKAELVRHGHPADDITVIARGETQPIVETPDGVREPQNRRIQLYVCPRWFPNCTR